jgi:hypothetical protein
MIARYEPELGKVIWYEDALPPKETCGESAAVWDAPDFEGIGLPGTPQITSRTQYRNLLRQHGCVEVGNEAPPLVREAHERRRTHGR